MTNTNTNNYYSNNIRIIFEYRIIRLFSELDEFKIPVHLAQFYGVVSIHRPNQELDPTSLSFSDGPPNCISILVAVILFWEYEYLSIWTADINDMWHFYKSWKRSAKIEGLQIRRRPLLCASQSMLQLKNSTQVTEAQEAPPPEDWVVRRRGDHVYISPSMQILVTPTPPTA